MFEALSQVLGRGVGIVNTHPAGLVALDKPAGVLSHPNKASEQSRALLIVRYDSKQQCYAWKGIDGGVCRAWLLHRLDSATSGVVLLATVEEVAQAAREAFEQRRVAKTYRAVVFGHCRERKGEWRDRLQIRRDEQAVRAEPGGGLVALASMRMQRQLPGPPAMSVLELEPHTGRTHQLRLQCAKRNLPIVGDRTYGNFKLNREVAKRLGSDRLLLHAESVKVDLALSGGRLKFAARSPLPPPFVGLGCSRKGPTRA